MSIIRAGSQRAQLVHNAKVQAVETLEHTNGIVRQQTGRWHRRQKGVADLQYESLKIPLFKP